MNKTLINDFLFAALTLLFLSCTSLQRSVESGYNQVNPSEKRFFSVSDRNMKADGNEGMQKIFDTNQIQHLERTLQTRGEKEQYAKVLPWLKSEDEKKEFLSLSSLESRKAWVDEKKILQRVNENNTEYKDLVDNQDIAIGMPMEFVKKSWGDPASMEVAGNPIYKNEKWKYIRQLSTTDGFNQEKRIVYFEGGRVVGWEVE